MQYPAFEKAWEAIVDAINLKPLHFHSQVSHYYFEGCFYYTPSASVPFPGNIHHREIVDIRTGQLVPIIVNGEKVPQ